jgi:hypothetical protein
VVLSNDIREAPFPKFVLLLLITNSAKTVRLSPFVSKSGRADEIKDSAIDLSVGIAPR